MLAVVFAGSLIGMGVLSAQQAQPEAISCPQIPGYESPPEAQAIRDYSRGEFSVDCFYAPTSVDEDGLDLESPLRVFVIWLSDLSAEDVESEVTHPPGVATSRCSDEEFFRNGLGELASGDRAVSVTYEFSSPDLPYSVENAIAASVTLREAVVPFAISCDGVEIIPRSSYYTPLPPYIADALTDIDSAAPASPDVTVTSAAPATTEPSATPPATTATAAAVPVASGDDPAAGAGSDTAKLVGFVLIGLSVVSLLWALALARKEHRVRPMFDVIRAVLIAGSAIGSLVLLGDTPPWAVAGGVAAGATLGWIQGRNVSVRAAGKRAYEKRNMLAIIVFGIGLVVSQGAGLLNRTGIIGIGVGVTFLSAATVAGLIAGRMKPLGLVRTTGLVWVAVIGAAGVGLVSTWAAATAQEPTSEEERKAAVIGQLTDAVQWDSIKITGGLFTNEGKPFAVVAIPPGFATPPQPETRTVQWTRTLGGAAGGEVTYQLTETFTFALNVDGVCCAVTYAGEGSTTRDDGETTVTRASGSLGDYVGVGTRRDPAFRTSFDDKWGLPFQETQMLQPGTDEPFCRRPVAQPPGFSSNGTWDVYETDGVAVEGGEPFFGMYTQCDIPGFDAATAQSLAPPVPAATAPEREVRDYGTTVAGCPVYQEAFNAIHAPSAGSAPTEFLQRMFMRPNSQACTGWVVVGEEGRGGTRSEMQFDLATDNVRVEATRLYDAAEDLNDALPLHEIPEDERCLIGVDGVAEAPTSDGETCRLRTFHKLGEGEITIWTDYDTSDGPNVIIRGAFPWGHYFYRCHHCNPFSPEVPRIIAAMHKLGTTGVGNFGPRA